MKRKHSLGQKTGVTLPPPDHEATRSTSMLLDYVLPRPVDALKFRVAKNSKYQLVAPVVPKGVMLMVNIVPNLQKVRWKIS